MFLCNTRHSYSLNGLKSKFICLTYWSSVFNQRFVAVLAYCTKIRKNTKKHWFGVKMTSWWRHNDVYSIEINLLIMFYQTFKFHVNCINTFGFMEGGHLKPPPPPPIQAQELQKSPGRIGLKLYPFPAKRYEKCLAKMWLSWQQIRL